MDSSTVSQFVPAAALFVIASTCVYLFIRKSKMTENRWVAAALGMIGIALFVFIFWPTYPHVALVVLGILAAMGIVAWTLAHPAQGQKVSASVQTHKPIAPSRWFTKDVVKWLWGVLNRLLFALALALTLFAIIWDTARPTFTAISWRLIATLWALGATTVYIQALRSQRREKTTETPSQADQSKTSEQVSEHVVKHMQAVAQQLGKLTFGSSTDSVKSTFDGIIADSAFSIWWKDNPLLVQLGKAMDLRLDQLFYRVVKYQEMIKEFNANDVPDIFNETRVLLSDVRSVVSELIQTINNLEKAGAPPVWNKEPLSGRVYRDLRDNYDELMKRVTDLTIYATNETKSLLPHDYELTKFDRIPGVLGQ